MYGIKQFIEESKIIPLDLYLTAPSCVPATNLETSGAEISPEEIDELLQLERVVGLAEVMDYPGVINRNPRVMKKIKIAKNMEKLLMGTLPV